MVGWWLLPAVATVAVFARAFQCAFSGGPLSAEYDASLDRAVLFGAAAIVSLASWLIWALVA